MMFWGMIAAAGLCFVGGVFVAGWAVGRNSLSLRPTRAEVARWRMGGG
jgi:hypothetical protein